MDDGRRPGASRRTAPQDADYLLLSAMKQELRQVARGGPRPPTFKHMERRSGLGRATMHELLDPGKSSMPTARTMSDFVAAFDRDHVEYWTERRDAIERVRDTAGDASRQPDGDRAPESPSAIEPQSMPARRHSGVVLGAAVVVALVLVGGLSYAADLFGRGSTEPEERRSVDAGPASASATGSAATTPNTGTPSDAPPQGTPLVRDLDDPEQAGCTGGSVRIATQRVGRVGYVSLVYSSRCAAIWARAERTDGAAAGNHVALAARQVGADREPVTADDADAPVTYTYVLTVPTVGEEYCAEAVIYVGETPHQGKACAAPGAP